MGKHSYHNAKHGWHTVQLKDPTGKLRWYSALYRNGRIVKKRVLDPNYKGDQTHFGAALDSQKTADVVLEDTPENEEVWKGHKKEVDLAGVDTKEAGHAKELMEDFKDSDEYKKRFPKQYEERREFGKWEADWNMKYDVPKMQQKLKEMRSTTDPKKREQLSNEINELKSRINRYNSNSMKYQVS